MKRKNRFLLFSSLLLLFLLSLCFWQLARFQEKLQIEAEMINRKNLPALGRLSASGSDQFVYRRVKFSGYFVYHKTCFLDNRTSSGQVGRVVFSAFYNVSDGKTYLVNRGWVSLKTYSLLAAERKNIHAQPDLMLITGIVYKPETGLVLSDEGLDQAISRETPCLVQALTPAVFDRLGINTSDYAIALDQDLPDSFTYRWQAQRLKAEKHLAYALQWALMATVLVMLMHKYGRKMSHDDGS
jgi:cytochrome oxidase assembly protein ShyY1